MNLPFKIKICGITRAEDAQAAAEAGADAIGLNFYSGSRRFISLRQAYDIAAVIPSSVTKIGVFVNPWQDEVENAIKAASLDMVQFHGNESADFIFRFQASSHIPIIKAFPMKDQGESIDAFIAQCATLKLRLEGILIDAYAEGASGEYGGTGKVANWQHVGAWQSSRGNLERPPMILAGGLSPANVADGIAAVRPHAVDTASGVESAPGVKDTALMRQFVQAAKRAFVKG